ncbi:hypothetical protein QTP70_031055, partial [Hemibagrus guttatus]
MDSPSTFFFNLEKKGIQQKTMCHLRRPDRSITSDPAEMRSDFYKQLYSAESCDAESAEDLLKELPQLHETQKEEIDRTINLQELTDAMSQLSTGRSPGIDGLPVDFYQHFWNVMGQDLHEVLSECIEMRTEEEDAVTDSILSFKAPQTSLKDMTKKGIYHITVKVIHKESLKRQKASRWPGMLNPDFLMRDRWRTLYKPPVEKRTADLQWRIIHGAVATDGHVVHLDPAVRG